MLRIIIALAIATSTLALAADRVESSRDIVTACRAYLGLPLDASENALHPQHHCRRFISAFLSAYAEGEKIAPESRVSGVGSSSKGPCIRLPEFLSFRDMAGRMVAQAERDPQILDRPAADLARKTLEHDFPCPATPAQ